MRRILLEGDCRETLAAIADGSADAIITDPPFAIVEAFGFEERNHRRGGRGRRLEFEWDGPATAGVVAEALEIGFRKLRRRASALVFTGADQFGRYSEPARAAGFIVKPFALVKECPPPAGPGNRWPSGFELGFYCYRGGGFFGDRDPKRVNVFYADALRAGNGEKLDHPTQKPLALMIRLVAALVPPAGIVLDPFCGTGTTLLAAEKLRRGWIGCEVRAEYCDLIRGRLGLEKKGTR